MAVTISCHSAFSISSSSQATPPAISAMDSDARLYREELTRLRHGNPVWEPNPDNLYDHIKIGDVGCFDNDRFLPLFNIMPLDDSNRSCRCPDSNFPESNFEVLHFPDNARTTQHRNPLRAGVYGHGSNLNISAAMGVDR
jgi:hypothetical protein